MNARLMLGQLHHRRRSIVGQPLQSPLIRVSSASSSATSSATSFASASGGSSALCRWPLVPAASRRSMDRPLAPCSRAPPHGFILPPSASGAFFTTITSSATTTTTTTTTTTSSTIDSSSSSISWRSHYSLRAFRSVGFPGGTPVVPAWLQAVSGPHHRSRSLGEAVVAAPAALGGGPQSTLVIERRFATETEQPSQQQRAQQQQQQRRPSGRRSAQPPPPGGGAGFPPPPPRPSPPSGEGEEGSGGEEDGRRSGAGGQAGSGGGGGGAGASGGTAGGGGSGSSANPQDELAAVNYNVGAVFAALALTAVVIWWLMDSVEDFWEAIKLSRNMESQQTAAAPSGRPPALAGQLDGGPGDDQPVEDLAAVDPQMSEPHLTELLGDAGLANTRPELDNLEREDIYEIDPDELIREMLEIALRHMLRDPELLRRFPGKGLQPDPVWTRWVFDPQRWDFQVVWPLNGPQYNALCTVDVENAGEMRWAVRAIYIDYQPENVRHVIMPKRNAALFDWVGLVDRWLLKAGVMLDPDRDFDLPVPSHSVFVRHRLLLEPLLDLSEHLEREGVPPEQANLLIRLALQKLAEDQAHQGAAMMRERLRESDMHRRSKGIPLPGMATRNGQTFYTEISDRHLAGFRRLNREAQERVMSNMRRRLKYRVEAEQERGREFARQGSHLSEPLLEAQNRLDQILEHHDRAQQQHRRRLLSPQGQAQVEAHFDPLRAEADALTDDEFEDQAIDSLLRDPQEFREPHPLVSPEQELSAASLRRWREGRNALYEQPPQQQPQESRSRRSRRPSRSDSGESE